MEEKRRGVGERGEGKEERGRGKRRGVGEGGEG